MQTLALPNGTTVLIGKNRNPFAVIFLSFITFGIYWLAWIYKVNSEIGSHEPLVRVSPARVMLTQFVPLANIVSDYNTAMRINKMELADGRNASVSAAACVLFLFFFGIGYVFLVQGHLNNHWDGHRFAATSGAMDAVPTLPELTHMSARVPVGAVTETAI